MVYIMEWEQRIQKGKLQSQQTINDRTVQNLFPPAACRLSQHNLRDAALAGYLYKCLCYIVTLHAYNLGPQVFSKNRMLFQPALRFFTKFAYVRAIFEE